MESVPNQRFSTNGGAIRPPRSRLDTNTSSHEQQRIDDDSPVISPVTSPPYWVQSHQRTPSTISVESIPVGAITLEDNTGGEDPKNKACWAKSVYIEDHVVINGNYGRKTGIGAFVVWNITVETLRVSPPWQKSGIVAKWTLCRVALFAFESDTPNSTTCVINSFKRFPIPLLLCRLYRRRALYRDSGPSFWKTGGLDYNTSLSKYC
jgi:hypothetical protein